MSDLVHREQEIDDLLHVAQAETFWFARASLHGLNMSDDDMEERFVPTHDDMELDESDFGELEVIPSTKKVLTQKGFFQS